MAADTALKRYSAMDMELPWRGLNVIPDVAIPQGERQAAMLSYSGILFAAAAVTITVILTDFSNVALPNLTGLKWAWWDDPNIATQVAPSVTGTGATTDATGLFSIGTLTGTALVSGQTGWIEITNSDGTTTQSPVGNVAAGPITTN